MAETMLKIGQVHALLRREFTGLELSKIRYYEEQGLVNPGRTKNGYRQYAPKHIECLREAIRLADEEFLPLRIVRHRLIEAGLLEGEPVAKPTSKRAARAQREVVSIVVPTPEPAPVPERPVLRVVADEVHVSPPMTLESVPEFMDLPEFVHRSGVDHATLATLIGANLLSPIVRGAQRMLAASDLAVAQSCHALLRNGADARLLSGLRRVVEREVGIVQDLTAHLRASANKDESTAAIRDTHRDVAALRAALMARELNEFFDA